MTPEQFSNGIDDLIVAMGLIVALPLEQMESYVETVERMGEDPNVAAVWTTERRETTAYAGRLIAAAMHARGTAAMGGAS